tara:strand:- start:497 stop:670 length:174 start_codon:yes stop_codon:yes gene_type:complete
MTYQDEKQQKDCIALTSVKVNLAGQETERVEAFVQCDDIIKGKEILKELLKWKKNNL